MDAEKIAKRIADLFALAGDGGASAHEAEAATRAAQALMAKHRITEAAVRAAAAAEGGAVRPEPVNCTRHGEHKSKVTWLGQLMMACGRANGCTIYWDAQWSTGQGRYLYSLTVVGAESDRQLTIMLYDLLVEQINRSTRRECRGEGRTVANNFRLGMIDRIGRRLHQANQQAEREAIEEASGAALVLVKSAITERKQAIDRARGWLAEQGVILRQKRSYNRQDADARARGFVEGGRVTLKHDRVAG
jgi:flagellin-specific chaperone FliS